MIQRYFLEKIFVKFQLNNGSPNPSKMSGNLPSPSPCSIIDCHIDIIKITIISRRDCRHLRHSLVASHFNHPPKTVSLESRPESDELYRKPATTHRGAGSRIIHEFIPCQRLPGCRNTQITRQIKVRWFDFWCHDESREEH